MIAISQVLFFTGRNEKPTHESMLKSIPSPLAGEGGLYEIADFMW
jgi:hypothetical protein